MTRRCSVTKNLEIVRGGAGDYQRLARFHYRDCGAGIGPWAAIFAMRSSKISGNAGSAETVGVIVYTMPSTAVELRNVATGNMFAGLDRSMRLALINKTIRCIRRVIIEPRFRGLGLASRLVRETMPQMGAPIVEALAVMGLVNPFFEKAGMMAYKGPVPVRCVQLAEAFSMVGIEEKALLDSEKVRREMEQLPADKAGFIEFQIRAFLANYGKRAQMEPGPERMRFVLGKLGARPVYYVWFNPEMKFSVQ